MGTHELKPSSRSRLAAEWVRWRGLRWGWGAGALFVITAICSTEHALSQSASTGPRPANVVKRSTQKPYPFFPSAQTTPNGQPVSLDDYASNEECMNCHNTIGHEWRGSTHAAAMTDPFFLALYKLGHKETNGLTDKLCAGCHSSPMVVSGHGAPDELEKLDSPVAEGVSCVVCHSISRSHLPTPGAVPANASFVTDPAGPIVGPHADRPCEDDSKQTVCNELFSKSEFCANCHGVVHPINGLVIERTYDEWRGSIYAAKGIQCQDCHMQPAELAIRTARTLQRVPNPGRVTGSGPMRDHVYSHYFVGANTALSNLAGNKGQSRMAEKLLKGAASLEILLPDTTSPGSIVHMRVKVTNETAGHNLPTSLVEIRQMWLDVQVSDASGNQLFRSGAVDAQGNIDKDAVFFHAIAVDSEGKPTVKPWEMTRFSYVHTVPPRGYTLERYAFQVPPGSKGPVKVRADLRYRGFPQDLANQLLGKDAPVVPIVDMTSVEKTLELRP